MRTYSEGYNRVTKVAGLGHLASDAAHYLTSPLRIPLNVDALIRGMDSRKARPGIAHADKLRAKGKVDSADRALEHVKHRVGPHAVDDLITGVGVTGGGVGAGYFLFRNDNEEE